jgi:hypothetical protein
MPRKRGRPLSTDTTDPAIVRQRQQAKERMKLYRERKRNATAATVPQTEPQLQQAEAITERAFDHEDAARTLLGLGLRVQGVTLAQDASSTGLQQEAMHVEEHDLLYEGDNTIPMADQSPYQSTSSVRSGQSNLGQFFQTLPSQSPFAVPPTDTPSDGAPSLHIDEPFLVNNPEPTFREQTLVEPIINEINEEATTERDEEEERQEQIVDEEVDSDAETSVFSFVSARSSHSDEEEEEIAAHDYTVQKLYEQLHGGFHGCSEEQHREKLHEHSEAAGENHHSLNEIFNDRNFPSVLGLADMISADRLVRQPTPSPTQWRNMFCGIPRQSRQPRPRPMNVCLHKEETQAVEPQVAYDIDSFLGFASSLAMARQGIWYQPAPQFIRNITNNVHLETKIWRGGDEEQPLRSSLAMLRDVPHFLLGRIVGAHDITVHILFPHMVPSTDKFFALTKDQLSRWLDKIFHPAVYQYCEAHYTQHLPASYRHALADSKARQVEARQVETASYQAQQALGYHLQPEYLGEIWTEILQTIANTPGLADFRELQLYFSAKGTKLQFKTSPSRPTILDAMENFQAYFNRVIDTDFVYMDRLYVDVGKEICPRVSLLRSQQGHVGDEAQVYSWKRCCLKHYIEWMYDGQPPAEGQGQRYYDQNMLYEASSLTSLAPKRSRLRAGGLIYSQFYGSVKEISDASKCKPFENDGLEELALDPQIRQGARDAAGGNRRDAKIIERAYCASKRRTRDALLDSRKKSFGIREEHRISWSLFQGLIARLRLESRQDLEVVLDDCPSYAWAVKTEVYLNYLWRCADKFATGFEVVRAQCPEDLVTWEQTKIMAMFLRCLRFVFGGYELRRESALWWSRRQRTAGRPPQQRLWYGLGFCNTLPRYKYCWLEPRFNWNELKFRSEITDNVLFGNSMLRGQYLRRGGQVRDFFSATRQLELALEWMDQYRDNTAIQDRLISWMVHICLQQFRIDTLSSVKSEMSEEHQREALKGTQPFCYEYLNSIMSDGVYLISGNRCDFKQVSDLGRFLFDFDDGRVRAHWEDRPYRKIYRRAKIGLGLRHEGQELARRFQRRLLRRLYGYHWVLPYPCTEGLMQTTKQGERMWYSVQRKAGDERGFEWEWGRKSWRVGAPSELPTYLSWSKEEWIRWLEGHNHFVEE